MTAERHFEQSGQFGKVTVRRFTVREAQTSQQYVRGLRTYSSHRELDEDTRTKLYAGIGEALDNPGGSITLTDELVLFHAKVKR